jgi:hypothetical protein
MGSLSSSVRDPSAVEAKEAQVARAVSTEAGVGMTEMQDWAPSVPCECTPSHIDEPRNTVHTHVDTLLHCVVLCCISRTHLRVGEPVEACWAGRGLAVLAQKGPGDGIPHVVQAQGGAIEGQGLLPAHVHAAGRVAVAASQHSGSVGGGGGGGGSGG